MANGITVVRVFVREPFDGLPLDKVITLEQPDEGEVAYTDGGLVVSFRDAEVNRRMGKPAAHVTRSLFVPYWNVLAVRRDFT
jgi:hypothetical protein